MRVAVRPALLLIAAVACTALPAVTAASGQLPSVQLDQPALLGTSLLAGGARRLRHEEGQGSSMAPPQAGGPPEGGSQGSGHQDGKGGSSTQQGGGGGGGKRSTGPAMPLPQWASETLAHDGWLMAAFIVAWAAAPGVALLCWAMVFDTAMSLAPLFKAPAAAAHLARLHSSSSFK